MYKNNYLLPPTNIYFNTQAQREQIFDSFQQCVDALNSPCVITVYRDWEEVHFGCDAQRRPFIRIILSTNQTLDGALSQLFPGCKRDADTDAMLKPFEIRRELPSYVETDAGLVSWLSLRSMPRELDMSWVYDAVFANSDVVRIFINPVDPSAYDKMFARMKHRSQGDAGQKQVDGFSMIGALDDMIRIKASGKLVSLSCSAGVFIPEVTSLKDTLSAFKTTMNARRATFCVPYWQQRQTCNAGFDSFYLETGSMRAFMPFFVSELFEDGGLVLGENLDTGTPVKWNRAMRSNYSIAVVAPPGSGKSWFVKMFLARTKSMYPDSEVTIIDIENEYLKFADALGFDVITVEPHTKLGLDFFKFTAKNDAASAINSMINAPQSVKNEVSYHSQYCTSMDDLFGLLLKHDGENNLRGTESCSSYMKQFQVPPISFISQGTPDINPNTVFAIAKSCPVGSFAHQYVTMAMMRLVNTRAQNTQAVHIPKTLVLDEFWSVLRNDEMSSYVIETSKRGRKYNVGTVFATQNLDDILENPHAKAVFNNSDTKIFMLSAATEKNSLIEKMGLSPAEVQRLLGGSRGEAILHVGNRQKLNIKFLADAKEAEIFNTNPYEQRQT